VDLARMAGLKPAAVICEIMNADGTMARMPELVDFGRKHRVPIVAIADLIDYRLGAERQVRCVAEAELDTAVAGRLKTRVYRNDINDLLYLAVIKGDPATSDPPALVRVHSGDVWGDALDAERLDGGIRLRAVLEHIALEPCAVLLYILKPFSPRHVVHKLAAHSTEVELLEEDRGSDDAGPDGRDSAALRDYGLGAQVLRDVGVREMRLVSNRPKRIAAIEGYGLRVVETVSVGTTDEEP
jgi:3,4-dihydroxy 2-butanone 4-phosphate synthase/GTP cyclohydrolase II